LLRGNWVNLENDSPPSIPNSHQTINNHQVCHENHRWPWQSWGEVIDYLAAGPGCSPFREKFEAFVAELKEGDETILLVKPLTFMNLSGRAVRAILDFYKLPVEQVLIVCDDFNLPLGKLRVRAKGSHGGQNGLRNIQEQLDTDVYARLRIGVGQPTPGDAVDFVLSKFKPGERAATEEAIAIAAQATLVWVRQGVEASMNRFNGSEDPSNDKGKVKKEKPKNQTKPNEPPKN
jgi:PTH1 family peptidyl-tRNA hydrolase